MAYEMCQYFESNPKCDALSDEVFSMNFLEKKHEKKRKF